MKQAEAIVKRALYIPTVTKTDGGKMLPYGINNLTRETQNELRDLQSSLPPKRKRRPKTAKTKNKNEDSDDGELFGTRIEQCKT